MISLWTQLGEIYHQSKKPQDIAWNTYVARPLAAILVWMLRPTPLTPNQITFLGTAIFVASGAAFVFLDGPMGFLIAVVLVQLSYLFDCVDGQLARLKDMTSDVGAYLDFLMDEIKALILVAAVTCRLWLVEGDTTWLLVAIASIFIVATATSLTHFVRRPEYAGEVIEPGDSARRPPMPSGLLARLIWLAKATARYFIHYPSWILWAALIGFFTPFDPGWLFIIPFLGVYLLYLAQTGAAIVFRLGHPRFYD